MKRIGVITYNRPHTKTAMIVGPLLALGFNITLIESEFSPRKPRVPLINHRPEMFPEDLKDPDLADLERIPLQGLTHDGRFDFYVIAGAGLIQGEIVDTGLVINGHAGMLPFVRGLDSFKWALLLDRPLGVSIHLINQEADAGRILASRETPIFPFDTIDTLASRHYRNEIALLIETIKGFDPKLKYPVLSTELPPTMRMKNEEEQQLLQNFPAIKARRASPSKKYFEWL
jgi:phosphoribosylglycinamide formyltransferase-1